MKDPPWLGGKGGVGVTPSDIRGVGGSSRAGIGARDVPGDPAPLAQWVQLPSTQGFGILKGD